MLYTFCSKAGSDVLMLGTHAKEFLRILGKDPEAQDGVFTVEQVGGAWQSLDRYSAEYDRQHPRAQQEDVAAEDDSAPGAAVPMHARALPLIQLLQAANEQKTFVTWAGKPR